MAIATPIIIIIDDIQLTCVFTVRTVTTEDD